MTDTALKNPAQPWWKFPHVWMVISGPALVVVASLVTYYIAAHGMDKVIEEPPEVSVPATAGKPAQDSLAPAIQARNHAATGVAAKP